MTKYFVDQHGAYLGGFDGAEPPDGAIEVLVPPARGSDIWDGAVWVRVVTPAEHNAPILAALEAIDARTIRPLREGDAARIAALDAEASALRAQLIK